jgi:cytochrome c oxidase subunit 2
LDADRKPRTKRLFLVLLAVLALTAAACGGGDDGGDGGGDGGDDGGGGGGETATVSVSAADFSFDPSDVPVPAGAEVTVTFENTGEAPHTMTADDLGLNVEADPGQSAEGTFTAPDSGSVDFHCEIHPDMTGTISVDGSADAGGSAGGGGSDKSDKKDDDSSGYDY